MTNEISNRFVTTPEAAASFHDGKKRIPPEIAMEMAEHHTQDALSERHL